jgi:hypothetical protein
LLLGAEGVGVGVDPEVTVALSMFDWVPPGLIPLMARILTWCVFPLVSPVIVRGLVVVEGLAAIQVAPLSSEYS